MCDAVACFWPVEGGDCRTAGTVGKGPSASVPAQKTQAGLKAGVLFF